MKLQPKYGLPKLDMLIKKGDEKALRINRKRLNECFYVLKTEYYTRQSTIDDRYFAIINEIENIFNEAGFDIKNKDSNIYYTIVQYELSSYFHIDK